MKQNNDALIKELYNRVKSYVDSAGKDDKKQQIMEYAVKKAKELGEVGNKIINSPAFLIRGG